MEQACRAPLNKALCSVLRISLETSSDVPALLWSPVVQGLLPIKFILQSVRVNGNRLSPEPDRRSFATIYLDLLDQFPRWSQTGTVSTICLLGYFIKILVVIFFIGIYPYSLLGSNWTRFWSWSCLSEYLVLYNYNIHLRGDLPWINNLV